MEDLIAKWKDIKGNPPKKEGQYLCLTEYRGQQVFKKDAFLLYFRDNEWYMGTPDSDTNELHEMDKVQAVIEYYGLYIVPTHYCEIPDYSHIIPKINQHTP